MNTALRDGGQDQQGCVHVCTHARMQRMHACTARTARTHARMHACTHARMHACTHAMHAHTYTQWAVCICMHAPGRRRARSYTVGCVHMHACTWEKESEISSSAITERSTGTVTTSLTTFLATHLHMHVYVYVYTTFLATHLRGQGLGHACARACMHMRVHACIYAYMHVRMHVCARGRAGLSLIDGAHIAGDECPQVEYL